MCCWNVECGINGKFTMGNLKFLLSKSFVLNSLSLSISRYRDLKCVNDVSIHIRQRQTAMLIVANKYSNVGGCKLQ
jgi:hypothetical protein